jgi:pimeloyl-ACP methyl ester carboxylesterase
VQLPPYRHRTIDASGVPIHLVELPGDGPPLLLIHGIGMDWRVWQAISRRLHPYFHLYFVDLRGHGNSGKPATGYSVAQYAADVEDVIDALGLTGLTIVGSSLGGMVALALEAPVDVITHRILVDPPLTGGPVRDPATFSEILRLKDDEHALTAYLASTNPGVGNYYLRTMAEMWREAAEGVITDMLAHSRDYFDLDGHLPHIDAPTLIMQADPECGGVLRDDQAGHALSLLPLGRLVKVAGSGHAIHASKPDGFVRLVREFAGS